MNVLDVSNPQITAAILLDAYKEMSDAEFKTTLDDIISRGEQFAKSDDSAFSGSLSEADATLYACCCRPFNENLRDLGHLPRTKVAMYTLSRTVAWWQTINAFRTIHGS